MARNITISLTEEELQNLQGIAMVDKVYLRDVVSKAIRTFIERTCSEEGFEERVLAKLQETFAPLIECSRSGAGVRVVFVDKT
jgi:hypothetical protein